MCHEAASETSVSQNRDSDVLLLQVQQFTEAFPTLILLLFIFRCSVKGVVHICYEIHHRNT